MKISCYCSTSSTISFYLFFSISNISTIPTISIVKSYCLMTLLPWMGISYVLILVIMISNCYRCTSQMVVAIVYIFSCFSLLSALIKSAFLFQCRSSFIICFFIIIVNILKIQNCNVWVCLLLFSISRLITFCPFM